MKNMLLLSDDLSAAGSEPVEIVDVFPPIPDRRFDFSAYRDPERRSGAGPTPMQALADLLGQEWEDEPEAGPVTTRIWVELTGEILWQRMTPMRIEVFLINDDDTETSQGECLFTEAMPEPDDEQALAYQALRDTGSYIGGGGASPLFRLVKIEKTC